MAQIESRSDNFITRLNQWLEAWSKRYLPAWLYREVMLQPDRRLLKSNTPKAARNFALFLAGVALVTLIISLLPS